jgi:hypothetical protein
MKALPPGEAEALWQSSLAEMMVGQNSASPTGNFQQHRFAIQSQGQPIAVAQAQINVLTSGQNEE